MAFINTILSSPGTTIRNIDRVLEDAQLKGELKLNSRKLKEFPKIASKYDLSDVVKADLSKNRLSELPEELCSCPLLEELDCYNNVIRSVPNTIVNLQSLAYLNLSRNQLTVVPIGLCHLPLQICILRNNHLVSIPEEISLMKCLKDLDVSCNEITIIPPQLGNVETLQRLNLKRNLIVEIPVELCQLCLHYLDLSANRISTLPINFRNMTSLQELILDQNPWTFPPALLCKRGRIHVFKFLEIQAIKEDKRDIVLESEFQKFRSPSAMSDSRIQNDFIPGSCRKSYTFDSGYSTSDGDFKSQESQDLGCNFKTYPAESSRWETATNLFIRNQNTNPLSNSSPSNNDLNQDSALDDNSTALTTVQTFKEYKEALKKKREAETTDIYKKSLNEENGLELSPKLPISKTTFAVATKYILRREDTISSSAEEDVKNTNSSLVNPWQFNTSTTELTMDNIPKIQILPNNDIKSQGSIRKDSPDDQSSSSFISQEALKSFLWSKNSYVPVKPVKSKFTMKREFDKAREEQELISQLREILESRLKVKLPDQLEAALNDGVFLCHLANNIQANSVSCIHVPSPAVPKLPVPKCRRNADNFLDACKQIGVPTDLLCSPQDILGVQGGLVRVAITVQELLARRQ